MPYVSKEQIAKARETNLLNYLQTNNPSDLVKTGAGRYKLKSHDSVEISNGLWFRHSQEVGGRSALDFLVKVENMDFVSAVLHLTDNSFVRSSPKEKGSYAQSIKSIDKSAKNMEFSGNDGAGVTLPFLQVEKKPKSGLKLRSCSKFIEPSIFVQKTIC